MPTLPTKSLFDKDLSLRSPFPRQIPAQPQTTVTPSSHEQSRTNTARMDFSQIKRPTPVKAKPAQSLLESPLPQSDMPHSLRNMLHYSKPAPLHNRLNSDKELDRLYNASPMPKIVDQAYSSLNVVPQRPRSHSLVLPLSNPTPIAPQIETSNAIDKEPVGTADLSDGMGFQDESQDFHVPDSPPSRLDSPEEQDNHEILDKAVSEEPSVQDPIQETAQKEPVADIVPTVETNETPDTENSTPSNPRKRKSQFKHPQRRSKVKKTAELASKQNPSKPHPDVETPDSEVEQTNGQEVRPSRTKVSHGSKVMQAKSKPSNNRRQSTEPRGSPTSRFSRIRSSVGQWFKGSFWDPPKSEKRIRRPPSQWWSPSDSVSGGSKSKKTSKKIVNVPPPSK